MTVRALLVGDPHVTPEELEDSSALFQLVQKTAAEMKVDAIVITGDLYNTHDILSTRVVHFWKQQFRALNKYKKIAVRGNHDQVTPSLAFPHAFLAHEGDALFVTEPQLLPLPGVVAMPYYYDPAEFIEAVVHLRLQHPKAHTLLCHQTFNGSTYDNGFYAKDGVDPKAIPFDRIVSGHIHTPQVFANVTYIGAPRWRTLADANTDRHIWVVDCDEQGMRLVMKAATDSHCRRIWRFDDRPELPAALDELAPYRLRCDRIEVNVYGPTAEYVRAREAELRAKYGVRPKGFPDRAVERKVSEAMGIDTAFVHYAKDFRAPHGTPAEILLPILRERLQLEH
jgi:DNA repair exonuclease SbcCD nuclease subunit